MAFDVFLSYAHKDRAIANYAAAALADQGLAVWYDTQIEGGADWRHTIIKNLETSRCLVVLFSEATNRSRQVRKEIAVANRLNIPVIPVRLDGSDPRGALLHTLSERDWITLAPDPIAHMDEFAKVLLNALKEAGRSEDRQSVTVSTASFQPRLGLFPFNRGDANWFIGATLFFFLLDVDPYAESLFIMFTPIFMDMVLSGYPIVLVRFIYRFAKANRSFLSALPTYVLMGIGASALHYVTIGLGAPPTLESFTFEEVRDILARGLLVFTPVVAFLLHTLLRGILAAQAMRRRARA